MATCRCEAIGTKPPTDRFSLNREEKAMAVSINAARQARLGGMVNTCELLINVVMMNKPKMLAA